LLENVEIDHDVNTTDFRFPVQWVCRPQTDEYHDFRVSWDASRRARFRWRRDHRVAVGRTSKVKEIVTYDGNLQTAYAPQSITITLTDEIDISRGDMFVKADYLPTVAKESRRCCAGCPKRR